MPYADFLVGIGFALTHFDLNHSHVKTAFLTKKTNRPHLSALCSRALHAFTLVEIMIVVVIIGLLAALAIPAARRIHQTSQDRTVLNNARQLSSAANQYYMETGASTVSVVNLVGTTNYIKSFSTVANETYPTILSAGTTITITGVGGSRTITFEH